MGHLKPSAEVGFGVGIQGVQRLPRLRAPLGDRRPSPPTSVHSVLAFPQCESVNCLGSLDDHVIAADSALRRRLTDLSTSVNCVSHRRVSEG